MNWLEFVSQLGTDLRGLAERAENVTAEVTGSNLRLMRNLYDEEHTHTHSYTASKRFLCAGVFFYIFLFNLKMWPFEQLNSKIL